MSNGAAAAYDAIIVGAGPAGSVCAATLAMSGRRVLMLDKARFPRDKVCGDCLNIAVQPILDRLGLRERVRKLPHVPACKVSYHGIGVPPLSFPISHSGEIVVKRRDFDTLLVQRATELGAEFRDETPVIRISDRWTVETQSNRFQSPLLFAADGRNSTLARLAGWLPPARRERTAIQCHVPRPVWHEDEVRMLFYPGGYGGTAAVGETEINVCLVANPVDLDRVRLRAEQDFNLRSDTEWRTIAPLSRNDASPIARDGLFLLGDAARVVEPFTGEGIYYAMRSGELAAQCVIEGDGAEARYRRQHRAMYRGRLWINRVARLAGLHPRVTSLLLRASHLWRAPLGSLTSKVLAQT
jgi:geranylgeranyl reductase family protein